MPRDSRGLAAGGAVGGTAAHGEVIAADDDPAPLDAARAHHVVRWPEGGEVAVLVRRHAGEDADLAEGAVVQEAVDALADGELAAAALTLDVLLAAHPVGELSAVGELVQFRLPDHARAPLRGVPSLAERHGGLHWRGLPMFRTAREEYCRGTHPSVMLGWNKGSNPRPIPGADQGRQSVRLSRTGPGCER